MTRPAAQPVARQSEPRTPRSGPTFPQSRTRKDSPLPRISPQQLERIDSQLTELDRAVLTFVSEYRLASSKQLVRQFWPGDDQRARNGRRALKRLREWRVLDALPDRARGGLRGGSDSLIYGVGTSGTKLLARRGLVQKRLGSPGARRIAHTLTIAEVAIRIAEADRVGALECIEIQAEPACWRPFIGAMGARQTLKPDLYIRVAQPGSAYEYRWFCEIDMATEHRATLLAKCNRYTAHYRSGDEQHRHGVYPKVLFVVPDARREGEVQAVLQQLPPSDRQLFATREFASTAEFLSTEAGS